MEQEKVTCKHCKGRGFNYGFSGQAIRSAREKAKVSLREMGRVTGFSAAFLSDVELGRRNANEKIISFIESL